MQRKLIMCRDGHGGIAHEVKQREQNGVKRFLAIYVLGVFLAAAQTGASPDMRNQASPGRGAAVTPANMTASGEAGYAERQRRRPDGTGDTNGGTNLPCSITGTIADGLSSDGSITIMNARGGNAQLAVDPSVVATQAGANALLNTSNKYAGSVYTACSNNTSNGTINNLLAKDDGTGKCVLATTSDTTGIIGVIASGGARSGTALVQTSGIASCIAGMAVVAGQFAIPSRHTNGRCDSAASPGAGVEKLGTWITSGATGTSQSFRVQLDMNAATMGSTGSSVVFATAYNSTSQSIPPATATPLTFDTNRTGSNTTVHSTTANNTRFTAPTDGVYLATCGASWAAAGSVQLFIRLNGAPPYLAGNALNGTDMLQNVTSILHMAAADYVECVVFTPATGGAATAASAQYIQTTFGSLSKLGN